MRPRLYWLFALASFAFLASSACAATSPLAGAHLTVLPNGLRLIHREHRSAPLVAIDVWVRAGSGRELANESGAAHFLEHLLFKGTPTRKPGEIDEAIEDLGATLAAGTTRDGAHFYTTVAAEHAPAALEVIADALQHATLDAAEMERERAVILDELARAQNDGRKQATNALYADLYRDGAYGRPVLGKPDSIRSLTRETVDRFYSRWYAPNYATVVVVGDIPAEDAEALVKKHLGGWPKREEMTQETAPGAAPAPVPQPGAAWTACGVRLSSKMDAAEVATGQVLVRLLADGDFGRIPAAIKAAAEPVQPPVARKPSAALTPPPPPILRGVVPELNPHRDGGVLSVSALAEKGDPATALKPVLDALVSFQREAVTAEEMDYARRRATGAHLFAVETYAGQARALGEFDVMGDYTVAVELADKLARVKADDIAEFARRWLEPARIAKTSVLVRVGK